NRGFAGPKGEGQVIAVIADAELARRVGDLRHPDGRRRADGHQVARLLDAPAHGVRPGRAAVEIDEAFVAEPRALPDAEWRIQFDRRRGEPVLERSHVNDRLERRSRLTLRLSRAIIA